MVLVEDRRKQAERELVEVLGSEGRLKLLITLARRPNDLFTIYSLVKATGLRRQDVRKYVEKLHELGWVKLHSYEVKKLITFWWKQGVF